jgi:tetratricopeptide (TPR) repeat protein
MNMFCVSPWSSHSPVALSRPRDLRRIWKAPIVAILLCCDVAFPQASRKPTQKINIPAQDSLVRQYQAARTFSVVGDSERAAAEYRVFLAEALRQMANARVNEGNLTAATGLFDEAIALAPDNGELRMDFGNLLLRKDDSAKAKVQAEKALELLPGSSKVQYLLGRILYQEGDYKGAKEYLESAAAKAGGDIGVELGYDLAITYLKLGDVKRASLLFDEMMHALGDSARIHVYFGHAYLMGDQYDRAISEFKQALQKDPGIKDAHYFLGLAYLSRDEDNGFDENAAEDRAEIQNNPDDFRPHYDLGNIDLKLHRVEEAERELKRSAEIEPHNPDPLIELGELFISQRRLAEAEAVMARAIALTKDVSRNGYQVNRAYYVLGRIQMETGLREAAVKNLNEAAALREKAQTPVRLEGAEALAQEHRTNEQALRVETVSSNVSPETQRRLDSYFERLKPAIADAYNNLGVAAAAHKDYSTAISYFRRAGEWKSDLETLDRNLGMAEFYSGNYQDAVAPLYHVLERDPNDQRVRTALGLSYFSVENYKATRETLQPIEKLVAGDPGSGSAYAVSLIKNGEYDEGMARLKTLERANPEVAGLHSAIGETYADQGIYATAIDEYKRALNLDPAQARTHYLLGVALLRDGKPAEAVPEFRDALKENPSDATLKYNLALALLQSQRKDEALPLLQQVIQQDPKYADAFYELGKLELESSDTGQAIGNLEMAARLSPASDYIHYQLSLAYGRDSRPDEARREMETYQRLKTQRRGDHQNPRSN